MADEEVIEDLELGLPERDRIPVRDRVPTLVPEIPLARMTVQDVIRELAVYRDVGQSKYSATTVTVYERQIARLQRNYGSVWAGIEATVPGKNRGLDYALKWFVRREAAKFVAEHGAEKGELFPKDAADLATQIIKAARKFPVTGAIVTKGGRAVKAQRDAREKNAPAVVAKSRSILPKRLTSFDLKPTTPVKELDVLTLQANIAAHLSAHEERVLSMSPAQIYMMQSSASAYRAAIATGKEAEAPQYVRSFETADRIAALLRKQVTRTEHPRYAVIGLRDRIDAMAERYQAALDAARAEVAAMKALPEDFDARAMAQAKRSGLPWPPTREAGPWIANQVLRRYREEIFNAMLAKRLDPMTEAVVLALDRFEDSRWAATFEDRIGDLQDALAVHEANIGKPDAARRQRFDAALRHLMDVCRVRHVQEVLRIWGVPLDAPDLMPPMKVQTLRKLLTALRQHPYRPKGRDLPHLPPLSRARKRDRVAEARRRDGERERTGRDPWEALWLAYRPDLQAYQDALAVQLVYGVRTSELAEARDADGKVVRGVRVDRDAKGQLSLTVLAPLKVREEGGTFTYQEGLPSRSMQLDMTMAQPPWVRHLAAVAERAGGSAVVSVPSGEYLSKSISKAAKAAGVETHVTSYSLRHDAAARYKAELEDRIVARIQAMKAEGADLEDLEAEAAVMWREMQVRLATFMGHLTVRTPKAYGRAAYASSRSSGIKSVSATAQVKRDKSPVRLLGAVAKAVYGTKTPPSNAIRARAAKITPGR